MKNWKIIAGGMLSAVAVNAELTITTVNDVPAERIAVSQPKVVEKDDGTAGIQSRYKSVKDWRAVAQSFKWTGDKPLGTLGVYVSRYDNSSKRPQEYILAIQELDGGSSRKVVKTVLEEKFTVQPKEMIIPGKWTCFNIGSVKLDKRKTYAFIIGPVTDAANMRSDTIVFWGWADGGHHHYPDGYASQRNNIQLDDGLGFPPNKGVMYGSTPADMSFFLQTVE